MVEARTGLAVRGVGELGREWRYREMGTTERGGAGGDAEGPVGAQRLRRWMNNVPGKGWCGLLAMYMVEKGERASLVLDRWEHRERLKEFLVGTGMERAPLWVRELDVNYDRKNGYIGSDLWLTEDEMVGYLSTKGIPLWVEIEDGWGVSLYGGDDRGGGGG